jgi:hypothetical protein
MNWPEHTRPVGQYAFEQGAQDAPGVAFRGDVDEVSHRARW